MREMLIDEHGEIIERGWLGGRSNQIDVPERIFETYVVRHLRCIHLRLRGTTLYVAHHPSSLTGPAINALQSALAATPFEMAVFSVHDEGAWSHELRASRVQAECHVARLAYDCAEVPGTPNRLELHGIDRLLPEHPLRHVLEGWKLHARLRDVGSLISSAEEACNARYLIADVVQGDAGFVLREFGPGYPPYAFNLMQKWLGRSLSDHPDKHYAMECYRSYMQAVRTGKPMIEVVEATTYWPLSGPVHRTYTRALLPFVDPSGRPWIFTTSIDGRGVVA